MPRTQSTSLDEIVGAAREICRRQGAHALTIAAVADRCGVSGATIYNYVEDKADLLGRLAAAEESPVELFARLQRGDVRDERGWLHEVVARALEDLRAWLPVILMRYQTTGSETSPPTRPREAVAALATLIEEREGNGSDDAHVRASVLLGACLQRVFGELMFREPVDTRTDEAFIDDLSRVLIRPRMDEPR